MIVHLQNNIIFVLPSIPVKHNTSISLSLALVNNQRPKQNEGFTQILANDRGHILPYVKRSPANPWGNFVGTWQMPNKLPGNAYV